MKLLLFLLTIIFITPNKVNAQTELEEWQYDLLERSTYYINDEIYNEIQEIDGEYYLIENVGLFNINGSEITWQMSSTGHMRVRTYFDLLENNYEKVSSNIIRDDIRSNYYESISLISINNGQDGFTFNTNYLDAPFFYFYDSRFDNLDDFRNHLRENNLKIYYKLTESKTTHLDWYDPTPPAPEPETNYSYLIMPTLFIISVVGYIIVRKKVII